MKRFISPVALFSAIAVAVVACTSDGPTSSTGVNLKPSSDIGIATAGQVQICLDAASPAGTYSVALSNFTGIIAGDTQGSTPQSVSPGNCILALTKGSGGQDSTTFVYPSGYVTSTITTGVAGTWTFSCVSDNPATDHCPDPATGSGNSIVNGASFPHGSTTTYTFHPDPVIQDIPTPLFVIGDVEAHALLDSVNFWGSQWWKNNQMSGFVSNGVASFKGYATESDNFCGGNWVAKPGNSGNPPNSIPSQIAIVVTSTVTKHGNDIGGDIVQILLVDVQPGYQGNPGHWGNGVVTQVVCPTA